MTVPTDVFLEVLSALEATAVELDMKEEADCPLPDEVQEGLEMLGAVLAVLRRVRGLMSPEDVERMKAMYREEIKRAEIPTKYHSVEWRFPVMPGVKEQVDAALELLRRRVMVDPAFAAVMRERPVSALP